MLHIWSVETNITPDLEKQQVGEGVPVETISDRLRKVLGEERSPWKWAEQVLLSTGAISRLLKDSVPDPAKLIPAIRVENLSLTWLLDGYGAPFIVAALPTDRAAAQLLDTMLADEPDSAVLVAWSDHGYTVVVHTPVIAEHAGKSYSYRQTNILGGAAPGPQTRAVVDAFAARQHNTWRKVGPYLAASQIYLPTPEWAALASGYMGNYALFGEDLIGGLAIDADPYQSQIQPAGQGHWSDPRPATANGVTEDSFGPEMDDLVKTFSRLNSYDRHAALRMLKGLHSAK